MTTSQGVQSDIQSLFAKFDWSGPFFMMVHPQTYKRHKVVFKKMMKRHRKRAFRRSVHRALRKAGQFPM